MGGVGSAMRGVKARYADKSKIAAEEKKKADPHTQWRKPKSLKEIKKEIPLLRDFLKVNLKEVSLERAFLKDFLKEFPLRSDFLTGIPLYITV